MASIEKRERRLPSPVPRPARHSRSRTFRRKADAERFAREVEVDMDRGQWIDPRGADVPLEQWVETFMTFARSLAPTTQQTYRRDLDRYILPRFGAVRLGRLSPEEIEIWLNDELAKGLAPSSVHRHYRTLRRVLQTAVEKDRLAHQPVRPGATAEGPEDGHDGAHVGAGDGAGRGPLRAVPHADLRRHRHRHALERARRAAARERRRRPPQDPGRRAARPARRRLWVRRQPKTDSGTRTITVSAAVAAMLADHLEPLRAAGPDALVFTNGAGQPLSHSSFQTHHFKQGPARRRRVVPIPRPEAHERRPGHRRGRPPEGDPGPHGPQLDHRHPRPLRPPLPRARRSDRHRLRSPTSRSSRRRSPGIVLVMPATEPVGDLAPRRRPVRVGMPDGRSARFEQLLNSLV